MKITLLDVFDELFASIKFDQKLAKDIYRFQLAFVNKNRDHLEFFGGNLLGVQVVRFTDADNNKFFDEVINVDRITLEDRLSEVSDIYQDNSIISDIFNLTCMYLIHRFITTLDCNDKVKHRAQYDSAMLFFMRSTAALLSYNFKYPTDPKIAQVAYANLSNKFLIKKLGSWAKVLDYRSSDLIDPEGIHYKTLKRFDNDLAIAYAITDSKDRIKDMIKNYNQEFYKVHESGESIGTTSAVFNDLEGEETVKEKTKSIERTVQLIRNNISDINSFINDKHISIISQINKNTSFKMIKQTLTYMCEAYNSTDNKLIDEFISLVIIYNHHLLLVNNLSNSKDYPKVLIELKNLYLSTRNEDIDLQVIRDLGYKIVKKSSKSKLSDSIILSTRTSIILYLAIKVFTATVH